MAIFGWDTSHYDGTITDATAARAASEGIQFASHKATEGMTNVDPRLVDLASFRDAGVEVLSTYHWVIESDPVADQVDHWLATMDRVIPWWRDWEAFFLQADCERTNTVLPSPSTVKAFCDRAAQQSGRTVICYASAGMYGDRLAGLGHPLWNAHYGANPAGPFQPLYPGDNSAGWAIYSGQAPALLQYGSKTIIAGLTTCDANAYRGTLAQLKKLIGVPMSTLDADDKAFITQAINTAVAGVAKQVWSFDPNAAGQGGLATPGWRPDASTNPTAAPAWFMTMLTNMVWSLAQSMGVDLTNAPALAPVDIVGVRATVDLADVSAAAHDPLDADDLSAVKEAAKQAAREGTGTAASGA